VAESKILRERLDTPSNWRGEWADGDAFLQQGIPSKPGVRSDAEAGA
jgi:hypothetical protein